MELQCVDRFWIDQVLQKPATPRLKIKELSQPPIFTNPDGESRIGAFYWVESVVLYLSQKTSGDRVLHIF